MTQTTSPGIIYLCNGGFQMAIDTIYDPAATWYIDLNSNVHSYIESCHRGGV